MNRTLDPVYVAIRDAVEPELERLGFSLDAESHLYGAFGSAHCEYHRRGARLRLTWDGKDRWAWIAAAPQPANVFPNPNSYRDVDAPFSDGKSFAPRLNTVEQAEERATELIARLSIAINALHERAV